MNVKPSPASSGSLSKEILGFQLSFDPLRYSRGKSHFQQAFRWVLKSRKREALNALYAYCRVCDDLADEVHWPEEERRLALSRIRAWLRGEWASPHPFWCRWNEIIESTQLSRLKLEQIVDGVEMDFRLQKPQFVKIETWSELENYADHVAGAVGYCVLQILSEQVHDQTDAYSRALGRCVQYINILRDIESDWKEHRLYIPREFLSSHEILMNEEKIADEESLLKIRHELHQRALEEFHSVRPFSWSCLPAEIMAGIYLYAAKKYWLFGRSRKLSKAEKSKAAFQSLLQFSISRRPA